MPLSEKIAEEYQEKLVNKISNFSGEGNMVIITHGPNVGSISFETLTNGTALIIKPTGDGEFEELGKIQTF